ncbi:MAG TPA: GNAT family N-acetyltransferase [Thermoanaerobaculia bacterium]
MNGADIHEGIRIRGASLSDCSAVAQLSGELGYPASVESIERRLVHLLGQQDRDAVFVAETDGHVIGWIHIARIDSLENDPAAEIRGLIVTEALRGRRIGASLVAAAEQWALNQRLARVRVRSNVTRERTHAFYERLGYVTSKSQKVFDRSP